MVRGGTVKREEGWEIQQEERKGGINRGVRGREGEREEEGRPCLLPSTSLPCFLNWLNAN